MRRTGVLLVLGLLVGLIGMVPARAQEAVADWTYMQYFAMDNNLEANVYNDLTELQAVGSTDRVNLVAQVDRIPGFEARFGDWTDTRRFLLQREESPVLTYDEKLEALLMLGYAQPDGDPEVLRQELQALRDSDPDTYAQLARDLGLNPDDRPSIEKFFNDFGLGMRFSTEPVSVLGEVNMGEAQSLADFLIWAIQTYPAERYALTISSHGAGWPGNGPDDSDAKDMLQLPEIVAALETARAVTGVEKLDLIGFDACLMGQLEVYETLAPYTDYVLAAEEVIPANGWEYTVPFSQLADNPTMTADQLGMAIVDAYMAYYAGPGARTKVDLHLVETSQLPAVLDALDAFATAAGPDLLDQLSALGVARTNAQTFGADIGDTLSGQGSSAYYSSVDLVSVMNLIAAQTDLDPAVTEAALAVADAAQAAVVYGGADSFLPDANGMAVYFPLNTTTAQILEQNSEGLTPYAEALPGMADWSRFLAAFHSTIDRELTPDGLGITITDIPDGGYTPSIYDPPVVVFDMSGQGIANLLFSATLLQDDGTNIMLDASPLVFESELPDGRIVRTFPTGESIGNTFSWNVEMPLLTDGRTQVPALVQQNSPALAQATITGTLVSQQDGSETAVSLIMNTETRAAQSVYGITEEGSPFEIRPQPGDKFYPDWYSFGEQGLQTARASDFLVFGLEPLRYDYAPAYSGTYQLSMLVQDLAGNFANSVIQVTVDNEGLDPAWRGFKDLDYGLLFLYPWGWTDPTVQSDEDGNVQQLVIDAPDGSASVYITAFDSDLETALQTTLDELAALPDAQLGEVLALSDMDGSAVAYTYTADDGSLRQGTFAVVWSADNQTTYRFDLDAPADQYDATIGVLDQLLSSLVFFPPRT